MHTSKAAQTTIDQTVVPNTHHSKKKEKKREGLRLSPNGRNLHDTELSRKGGTWLCRLACIIIKKRQNHHSPLKASACCCCCCCCCCGLPPVVIRGQQTCQIKVSIPSARQAGPPDGHRQNWREILFGSPSECTRGGLGEGRGVSCTLFSDGRQNKKIFEAQESLSRPYSG